MASNALALPKLDALPKLANRDLARLGKDVPLPMAALTTDVIAPANLDVLAQQEPRTIGRWERWVLQNELRRIDKQLSKDAHFLAKVDEYHEIREARSDTLAQIVAQNEDNPSDRLAALIVKAEESINAMDAKFRQVEARYKPLAALQQRRADILAQFDLHRVAIEYENIENELYRLLVKEALHYEELLIDRLTSLNFCYRWVDNDGRPKVDKVNFDRIKIGMDTLYFHVAAGYRTWRSTYRTDLPRGVHVYEIVDEKILKELAVAVGRQVTAVVRPNSGAWIKISRPNSSDGIVRLVDYEDMIDRLPQGGLIVPIGVGENRVTNYMDLQQHKHGLIVGMTGMGKSNMANALLVTLFSQHPPSEVMAVLIDMKGGVEFDNFESLPHIHGKIHSKLEDARRALSEMEWLMADRQARLRSARCKNIQQYNAHRKPAARWPHVVIAIDELASLKNPAYKTISEAIQASIEEVARKGRSVGLHLIMGTQRPSSKIVDGEIHNNVDYKIVFKMGRGADSMTALSNYDAASEIPDVPGRALIQIGWKYEQVQTPFLSDDVLAKYLDIARQYPPHDLCLPADAVVVHQELTPLSVAETMIKHSEGNVSAAAIFAAHRDEMTQRQSREMSEAIKKLGAVTVDGVVYEWKKINGRQVRLLSDGQTSGQTNSQTRVNDTVEEMND